MERRLRVMVDVLFFLVALCCATIFSLRENEEKRDRQSNKFKSLNNIAFVVMIVSIVILLSI